MAFISWTEPALARNYLNCLMKKVVIVDALTGAVWPTPDEVERYLNAIGSEAATLYREILAERRPSSAASSSQTYRKAPAGVA
jgi:hypothetical protein